MAERLGPMPDPYPPLWAHAWGTDRLSRYPFVEVNLAPGVLTRLRWIPPGEFEMGSPEGEDGRAEWEGPQHRVILTKGFWLADAPCTQAEWAAVMHGKNPSQFKSDKRPVEQVSWDDCQEFCQRVRERAPGLQPRLPTEAEWEYACRAGTKTSTYAGELKILGECNGPLLDEIAWYGGNSGVDFELENGYDSSGWPNKQYDHKKAGTHPVRKKKPNPWGLHDTLGNVWEWCSDYWSDKYAPGDQTDPTGPAEGRERVFRGGSWGLQARHCRSAFRFRADPSARSGDLGFRLASGQ